MTTAESYSCLISKSNLENKPLRMYFDIWQVHRKYMVVLIFSIVNYVFNLNINMQHPKPHESPFAFIIILYCLYLFLLLCLGSSNSIFWKQQTVFHSTHWKLLDLKFNVWNCVTKKTENWLTCTRSVNEKASRLRWLRRTWTGVNMSLGW